VVRQLSKIGTRKSENEGIPRGKCADEGVAMRLLLTSRGAAAARRITGSSGADVDARPMNVSSECESTDGAESALPTASSPLALAPATSDRPLRGPPAFTCVPALFSDAVDAPAVDASLALALALPAPPSVAAAADRAEMVATRSSSTRGLRRFESVPSLVAAVAAVAAAAAAAAAAVALLTSTVVSASSAAAPTFLPDFFGLPAATRRILGPGDVWSVPRKCPTDRALA